MLKDNLLKSADFEATATNDLDGGATITPQPSGDGHLNGSEPVSGDATESALIECKGAEGAESQSAGRPPVNDNGPEAMAARLATLFEGHERAHGTYGEPVWEPDKKKWGINGTARTFQVPVTTDLWRKHVEGERPLGVIPIRADGTCKWGSIDVDDYEMNLLELVERVEKAKLPLVPCRSKSGGLHLFVFLSKPQPAGDVQTALRGMANDLGLGSSVEIFPKQTELAAGQVGNWIAMPYLGTTFGGKLKEQVGIKKTGAEMTLGEFLRHAETSRLTEEQVGAFKARAAKTRTEPHATTTAAEGASYAARMLERYASELRHSAVNRNILLNKHAFHMGTMVARHWVEREAIEGTLSEAGLACGLDADAVRDVLKRAIDKGMKKPHRDLGRGDIITEDSAAIEFASRYVGTLLFDHSTGSWFQWTGSHWKRETTKLAFDFARELAREIAKNADSRVRSGISKATFAGSIERYAQADRGFAVTQEVWDTDPYLLGTPTCTVDLRTGEVRDPNPDDRITKITSVAPSQEAGCPTFVRFLQDATRGDEELVRCLRQVCGYALTGDTREHVLIFVYGPGGNGKSVFTNTITGILGDYATIAAMETFTFTGSHFDRHPTDLAMLRGARLVTAAETEEGRRWAETRIKQLTGGDPITARFMRRDFFTYRPSFKLMIIGNHLPTIGSVNDAMRRRFMMVPFVNKPTEPDRDLPAKLKAEWPGILRWMIEGCLDWQANGLIRPEVVRNATETYLFEQDLFGQWLNEHTEFTPVGASQKSETSGDLFNSWAYFARAAGELPGSRKSFCEAMNERGYPGSRGTHGVRVYLGIRLKGEMRNVPF